VEEGKRTARPELDAEDAILRRRVDYERLRARTAQNRVPKRGKAARISPVIDANRIVLKLYDNRRLTGRHQPLLAVLEDDTLPIPEALHEGSQRHERNVFGLHHP
jgi:hypothetical protein